MARTLRVGRGFLDEARDDVEGLVGMVDEDVALADRAPHVGGALERAHRVRDQRAVLEPRQVDGGVELSEVGERREPLAGVEVSGLQLELFHQPRQDLGREVGIVLEADRVTHPALAQALLDGLQEVIGRPPAGQRHVGVTRHPDRVGGQDLVAVVEPVKIQPDHVLEQHEAVLAGRRREPDEPGNHLGGDVDDRQRGARQDGRGRRPEGDDETEGAVDEVGEGVTRVDRERRHHREERPAEVLIQDLGLLGGHLLRTDDPDALGDEARLDVRQEAPVLLLDERVHALGDGRQGLGRRQPVGGGALVADPDPLLEVGHPDHEELVQVRAEDRQELDALQEGHGRVLGLLQHPPVELEPRQLAVDHALGHVVSPRR